MPIIYRGAVVADFYADDVEIRLSELEKKSVKAPARFSIVSCTSDGYENIGFDAELSLFDGIFCFNANISDIMIGAEMSNDSQTIALTDEMRELVNAAKAMADAEEWKGTIMAFGGQITCTLTDSEFTLAINKLYSQENIYDGASIQIIMMPTRR